jgi:hypothetical protein
LGPSVAARRVVGKAPAIAVAVEGDPDTLFVYDRRAPAGIAAAESAAAGFIRVAFLTVALIVLAGAGLMGLAVSCLGLIREAVCGANPAPDRRTTSSATRTESSISREVPTQTVRTTVARCVAHRVSGRMVEPRMKSLRQRPAVELAPVSHRYVIEQERLEPVPYA